MRRPLLAALALGMTVTACGSIRESRLNPFNWFGGPTAAPAAEMQGRKVAEDNRELAAQITDLTIEPTPDGAIVRATALPPTLGYWDAGLVAVEEGEGGKIAYEFRYRPPLKPAAASTPRARQIVAAAFLDKEQVATLTEVVVQGATNGLTSKR